MRRPAIALVLLLAGCAHTQPPVPSLESPRARIAQAEAVGVSGRALGELRLARQKLRSAEAAAAAGSADRAHRFAEQAVVHAELAEAMALTAQARDVLKEVRAGIRMLQEEAERVYPSDR